MITHTALVRMGMFIIAGILQIPAGGIVFQHSPDFSYDFAHYVYSDGDIHIDYHVQWDSCGNPLSEQLQW